MAKEVVDTPEEPRGDINEDIFDDSEEVSLLELDQDELAKAMEEAGISIKVDAEGFGVEVQVLSDDVSTFLILAPEEESTGAKVQGFIPQDDGELSALEMHGQLLEGDVLTHLNGSNARLMEFSDILKACRGPDRGGLPRPLVMRFSRSEALSVPTSPAPTSSDAAMGKTEAGDRDSAAGGGGGDVARGDSTGGGSGGSSLLEDLMGGLSLPGFASTPSIEGSQRAETESDSAARDGGERHRKIPGMAQIKGVFRAELQAQGVLGGSGGDGNGNGKSDNASTNGGGEGTGKSDSAASPVGVEGLFMNVLRRLESIEVLGEETPAAVAGPVESASVSISAPPGSATDNRSRGNGNGNGDVNGDADGGSGKRQGALDASQPQNQPPPAVAGGAAGGVGSSLAGVGAKLRSRLRKPGGFGLHGTPSGGGRGKAGGDGDSGKAFVEGATKALAINRERVMGWMKDLRPKDWSPRAAERRVEQDVLQDLRRAVRCLYLDAPDPPLHTSMVVARASASAKTKGFHKDGDAVDRVVGTGADKDFLKLVWFRSSSGGGFTEIEGVHGPYYQLSADDVGSRICVKCTLTETAAVAMEVAGVSPTRAGRRGRASPSPSPTRRQAQVAFAEVGPITLDPAVGKEVDASVAQEPAIFEGLVRRDVPGEKIRVRVEVGSEKVRVLQEPESIPPAKGEDAGLDDSSAKVGAADGEPVVLAEGSYSSGVLVSLDPMRPTALKLTILPEGQAGDGGGRGGGDDKKTFLLAAAYGRRRDVLALTLRRRRQVTLGPEVVVDDNPEATEAQQLHENYLELKAAAAHFAKAFDEDNIMTDEEDDDYEDEEEEEWDSEDSRSSVSSEGDEEEETAGNHGEGLDVDGVAAHGHGAVEGSSRECGTAARGGNLVSAPSEALDGDGAEQDVEGDVPRSLSQVLEDLREAREVAGTRGRRLGEAHAAWEAAEAGREKAEAELNLVSSELDLLRPLSRSLATRAEGKEAAEARAEALESELQGLQKQLTASQDKVEKLSSRVGTAEDEAGATAGKLSGLEKVVRRLGEEAEAANKDISGERAVKEEAMGRASKAERELDQARARAAVLENKLAALEKETVELRADTNASKARAEAIEEKFSSARAAEVEALTSRVSELEAQVSSLEGEKNQAVETMKSALSSQADAEARAKEAVAAEEQTRAQMAEKTEQVVQLTAQRNSAKNRADSLAKDLSRVCGGGRTVDQIEAIVTRYAELKVQMATMKAEQDGATADLHDQWPAGFDGAGKGGTRPMAEAVRHTLRQNTELNDRVAAMTETLEMRAQQLQGQRISNEFLLQRVEELERQVAAESGVPAVGTD